MQPQCDQLHVAGPHLPSGVRGLLQVAEEGPVRKSIRRPEKRSAACIPDEITNFLHLLHTETCHKKVNVALHPFRISAARLGLTSP